MWFWGHSSPQPGGSWLPHTGSGALILGLSLEAPIPQEKPARGTRPPLGQLLQLQEHRAGREKQALSV